MFDISTVGATLTFSGGVNCTVTEWSDEGSPFECPDIDISDNRKNLNGTMISSRTPALIPLSITVIPGSQADKALSAYFARWTLSSTNGSNKGSMGVDNIAVQATLSVPNINGTGLRNFVFRNGRGKSWPGGPSSSAEGRMSARTYSFEFEDCTPDTSGTSII